MKYRPAERPIEWLVKRAGECRLDLRARSSENPDEWSHSEAPPIVTVVIAHKRAEARSRYYAREEAQRLDWTVSHPTKGGRFLEEQEIVDFFPALRPALGNGRPDFGVLTKDGLLGAIIECKNDARELDQALAQAQGYAESINSVRGFNVRLVIGVAGSPDTTVRTRTRFLNERGKWVALTSHKYELTQLPTPDEMAVAIERGNGTTDVELPSETEFFNAAIAISRILRLARIEESARPKVLGAIITAIYHTEFNTREDKVLALINLYVDAAINEFDGIPEDRKKFLIETLRLSTDAVGLIDKVDDIVHQLERLNIRSILHSGVDFLGKFYETFLRYGCDTKSMGIVFTPRHITRFCAELIDVNIGHKVYDPASGTGGFLVAAFDRMWSQATSPPAKKQAKESIHGCDTNPTVWALAVLNMFFRGDGKSNLIYGSCFDRIDKHARKFDRVMLNPPFSQEGEPETQFIDHALASLKAGGEAAIVVPSAILVDDRLRKWRKALVEEHQVLGVVSLPPDLFYPVAAPTAILILRAHTPDRERGTFLAHVENDGYEIHKKRRVEREGSQLSEVLKLYRQFVQRGAITTVPGVACVVDRERIASGGEIIAHRWLPSAEYALDDFFHHRQTLLRSMSLAVAKTPEIAEELLDNFEEVLATGAVADRPKERASLAEWFEIIPGKTTEAKSHPGGDIPYVSSGDSFNSIEGFLAPPEEEIFAEACATITGFGQAYIQPWRFCARGGAGSAPHVLRPKFALTLAELFWFVGQLNEQKWRIYYGRMASKKRLALIEVDPPPAQLPTMFGLVDSLRGFQSGLDLLYRPKEQELESQFARLVALWRRSRGPQASATLMAKHPIYRQIVSLGDRAVPLLLSELAKLPDHWFIALKEITGVDPVPTDDRGHIGKMAKAWLSWGRSQGYETNVTDNVVPESEQR